jgi:hypothetical protein|tara:strand:+ start:3871 stop:4812 length:942 start_codon:yes stop_codon:yes gene_type:complete
MSDKYTNRTGISSCIADAIQSYNEDYDSVGWQSVTSLIDSPRAVLLKQRHGEKITEDVADLIWSFFGNMGHLIAERNASLGSMAERRFLLKYKDKEISFKPDLLERDPNEFNVFELNDFKFTSVYVLKNALAGNPKIEWVRQMNFYVWSLKQLGYEVSKIKLHIIARDWRSSEALREHNYPPNQCGVVEVPIWSDEKIKNYIDERIELFKDAEQLSDRDLPFCSQEERWADPDRFAVVKKDGKVSKSSGYKTALPKASSFTDRSEAQLFIQGRKDKDNLEIEYRKGESRRCARGYCKAAPFCNQFKEQISPPF